MSQDPAQPVVASATLEKLLNLSARSIQVLAKQGVIAKADRGRYLLWDSVRGYVRYAQERMKGYAGDGGGGDYDAHRTRLYAARADAQEILAARLKGTVHDATATATVMNEMIANARSRLLAIPTLAAPKVADVGDPNEVLEILTDAIHEALAELAGYNAEAVVARQLNQPLPEQSFDVEADAEPDAS
jgi:phage terminase Nu1 subunit (DNA packaging protein)